MIRTSTSFGEWVVVLLAFVALTAAATPCRASNDDASSDHALLRSQLEEIAKLVNAGEPRHFPAVYVRYFADDATLVTAAGSVIRGKDGVLAFYDRVAAKLESIEWEPGTPTILLDGTLAARWYTAVTRARYSGEETVSIVATRYSDVLRKQADGSWKIVVHAWTRR